MNKLIDDFGNTIEVNELIGFYKTIKGNKLLIYGKFVKLEDDKILINTYGFKGNPDVKNFVKLEYKLKSNAKFYKMQVSSKIKQ